MRNFALYAFVLVIAVALIAGGCEKKKEAEENAGAQAGQLDAMSENAKQLSDFAQRMESRKPVPPVNFKILLEFLPKSLPDMKPEEPTGETASIGTNSFSYVKQEFRSKNGKQVANIEIYDYAFISSFYMTYQMLMNMGYSRETTTGFEKTLKYGDFPAFERWDSEQKSNEFTVLVAERFIVVIDTQAMDEGSAKSIMDKIDIKKLAGTNG
jgi:hypothetical protein